MAPGCLFLVVLLATCLCAACSVLPAEDWERRTPQQAGISPVGLRAFSDYVGGRGCVVRQGYMVHTWGDAALRGDVASAAKPWYSHFLLRAFETGKVPDLDQLAVEWEPRLGDINPGLGHKDRAITWRHLANQTSCYGVTDAPGTAYDYNDWQMALFWDTLFLKVCGACFDTVDAQVLRPLLTDALQCQDAPTFMAFGTDDRPGRLGVSPRDFARFGLLYLHGGNWRGRQLLRRELAVMAVTSPLPSAVPRTAGHQAELIPGQRSIGSLRLPDNQTDHMGSYSWLWWTNGVDGAGRRHWPDAPTDTFAALGHGGRRAMVALPSLDAVLSWNDSEIKGTEMENEALRLFVASVVERDTTPGA